MFFNRIRNGKTNRIKTKRFKDATTKIARGQPENKKDKNTTKSAPKNYQLMCLQRIIKEKESSKPSYWLYSESKYCWSQGLPPYWSI